MVAPEIIRIFETSTSRKHFSNISKDFLVIQGIYGLFYGRNLTHNAVFQR